MDRKIAKRNNLFILSIALLIIVVVPLVYAQKLSRPLKYNLLSNNDKMVNYLFNNLLDGGVYIGDGSLSEMVGNIIIQGKERYNIESQGKCYASILCDPHKKSAQGHDSAEARISVFYLKEPAARKVYPILKHGDFVRIEGQEKRIAGYVYDLIIFDKDTNRLFAHARTYIVDSKIPVSEEKKYREWRDLSFEIDKKSMKCDKFHPLMYGKTILIGMSNTEIQEYRDKYYMSYYMQDNGVWGSYLLASDDLINWRKETLLQQQDNRGKHEECSIYIDNDGIMYFATRGPNMIIGKYDIESKRVLRTYSFITNPTRPSLTVFDNNIYVLCNSIEGTKDGLNGNVLINGVPTFRAHRCLLKFDKDLSQVQQLLGTSSLGGNYGIIKSYQNQLLILMNLNKNGLDADESYSRNGIYLQQMQPQLFDLLDN